MSSLWDRHVLPRVIGYCCGQPEIMAQRAKLVPLASGDVLELGVGGGANLGLYDRSRVTSLAGIDPSPELMEMARAKLAGAPADLRLGKAEALPFADGAFDTVVTTFTLCSVDDQARVLAEARRVLKPGGRLLFLEHGRSPDAGPRIWQGRIEPVWKRLMGNCHLTRPVADAVAAAGFMVARREGGYMEKVPRWAGWIEQGEAVAA